MKIKSRRYVRLTVAALSAVWLLGGCTIGTNNPNLVRGSGHVITEQRQVSELSEVVLTISGELIIVQDGTEALSIEGEDNIVPLISTIVSGGRLTIGTRNNASFSNSRPLRYHLSVDDLSYVGTTGSGSIEMSGAKGSVLRTETSGSGDLKISSISVAGFEGRASGSGDITASGQSERLTVRCTGSGSFNGRGLQSRTGEVELTGSGDAVVRVSDTLEATVSGSGSIKYLGSPSLTKHDSGSGEIEQEK